MKKNIEMYLVSLTSEVEHLNVIHGVDDINVSVQVNRNEVLSDLIQCNVLVKNKSGQKLFTIDLAYQISANDYTAFDENTKEEILHILQDKINNVVGFIGVESCKMMLS